MKYKRHKKKFDQYQVAIRNNFNKSSYSKRSGFENLFNLNEDYIPLHKEDEEIYLLKSWAKTIKPKDKLSDVHNINYKKIKNYLESKEASIAEVAENFSLIQKEMEYNLNQFKIEMDILVNKEMDRIFKEILK